jgi:hypothetical protein
MPIASAIAALTSSGTDASCAVALDFPRFRGHLIAGPSGLAVRIGVHAFDPAVFA